jgi:DNA-binding transcriptional MerR regulator
MTNIPEITMSIGDTAKELGVSVITLRRWAD